MLLVLEESHGIIHCQYVIYENRVYSHYNIPVIVFLM